MKEPDIKGPVAWQKFGDKWCLTGQYGMRPIFLSTDPKGNLRLRDNSTDRLIPFDPDHPFATLIVKAVNEYEALCAAAKRLPALVSELERLRDIVGELDVEIINNVLNESGAS